MAIPERFISQSADKCLPLFKILKKKANFMWNEVAKQAFQNLKEYLGRFPWIISPNTKKLLLVYLAVSKHAVSVVLLANKRAKNCQYII